MLWTRLRYGFAHLLANRKRRGLYYIGGPDVLPQPLSREEEATGIQALEAGGEGSEEARQILIERNLRLVAFISKREVQGFFLVGKVMHKLLCQPINRENDREALKTIVRCIQIIKEDKASIAVFPEGYIYDDRKLHHFRPGVFKIATKTKVPIVVCTMHGTHEVLPKAFKLKPSQVQMHLLQVIYPEDYEGLTTVELSERVYELMAADLGPELVSEE